MTLQWIPVKWPSSSSCLWGNSFPPLQCGSGGGWGLRSSNPRLPNQLVIHWISFESFLKTANGRSETQTGSVPKQHQIHFSPKQTGCENKSKPSPVIFIGFSIAASLHGLSVRRDHGLWENSKIRSWEMKGKQCKMQEQERSERCSAGKPWALWMLLWCSPPT